MSDRRLATILLRSGLGLLVLGLVAWASGLDLTLHPVLRLAATGPVPYDVALLSALGRPTVLGPVALVAVVLLAVRRRWRDALWLLVTVASGRVLVELLKDIAHRPRPPLMDRLETVGSWSFPSAHAANTMMTALALAVVAGGGPLATGAALAVAILIGWTRVALAVHWPGDVLAGWGIGMAWVAAAMRVRRERHR